MNGTHDIDRAAVNTETASVGFSGRPGRLAAIVVSNTVGTLATFGLYRFWARNRLRNYFWQHVHVAGEPAEYLGRPGELFGGFLGAVVFLTLVASALFAAMLYGPKIGLAEPPWQMGFVLGLAMLIPVAHFRARAYRLGRTAWRGVRFRQTGSSSVYMLLALMHGFLFIITLGLTYPFMSVELERYRVSNTRFGDRPFRFTARGSRLLLPWIPVWITGLAALTAGLFTAMILLARWADAQGEALAPEAIALASLSLHAPLLWAGGLTAFFFMGYVAYRVYEFRYFVSCTSFGPTRFSSRLGFAKVLAIVTPLALGIAAYAGIMGFVLFDIIMLPESGVDGRLITALIANPTLAVVFFVVVVFALALGVSILHNFFGRYLLIQEVSRTLTIENLDAVESVKATRSRGPRFGEGLADALGMGSF
jgi:uncharacterized membrane protein YjgN (DUF898 family)